MENNELNKKQAKRAAYIVGIAAFLGFSILMFMPTTYMNPFRAFLILGYLIFVPLGLLESYLLGLFIYFVFKHFVKSKLIYRILLVILIIICFLLGVSFQAFILKQLTKGPSIVKNEIDTNQDGRIDKWIYDYNDKDLTTIVEMDTDYNGTPNIKEYYKNGKLVKTEQLSNADKK